ncbi:DNA-directed RNA polymerase III subunit RPC4-like [Tubulanus polymorphus]|uniref:DNA-directed RNA polymerase III subunit RPC4-like n=1 Tax=Tubulanus polymorphus TaxID=672921 RepID=UPI003DA21B22
MSDKSKQEPMPEILPAAGSTSTLPRGLLGRSGTPSGKSARLPSLRGSRDLTLGGVPKKTFIPNIPVRRERKLDTKQEDKQKTQSTSGGRPRDGTRERGGRGRGRGRGEVIQSHSIFEQGPADGRRPKASSLVERSTRGDGVSNSSSSSRQSCIKTEYNDTKYVLDKLLRDDFIVYSGEEDKSMIPIKLPLCASSKEEVMEIKKEKKPIIDSAVKVEEQSTEDNTTTAVKQMTQAMKPSQITPAELFTNSEKSEEGELLFIQLPDVLPGTPASIGLDSDKKDRNEDVNKGTSLKDFHDGSVGKIVIHKSGKTCLVLGNMTLDLATGTPCSFLQELVAVKINHDRTNGNMIELGSVQHRLTCTPNFEQLLIDFEMTSST